MRTNGPLSAGINTSTLNWYTGSGYSAGYLREASRAIASLFMLSGTVPTSPALAQQSSLAPPVLELTDENNIDLLSGNPVFSLESGSIGGEGQGFVYRETWSEAGNFDNWQQWLFKYQDDNNLQVYGVVNMGDRAIRFAKNPTTGVYTVESSTYSDLKALPDGRTFILTEKDGTQRTFSTVPATGVGNNLCLDNNDAVQCALFLTKLVKPSGEEIVYTWEMLNQFARLLVVESSLGYKATLQYETNEQGTIYDPKPWGVVSRIDFYNLTEPNTIQSTIERRRLSVSRTEIKTTSGDKWEVEYDAFRLRGIRQPGSTVDNYRFAYSSSGVGNETMTVSHNGVSTRYSLDSDPSRGVQTKTDALGGVYRYSFDRSVSRVRKINFLPHEVIDPLSRITRYKQGPFFQIAEVSNPEGDTQTFSYDGRGNPTLKVSKAKPGSPLSDLISSASYPTSCDNPLTCNQPTSVTDANGNTTRFEYSADHGGVVRKTSPLVDGLESVNRYHYEQRAAWISAPGGVGWARSHKPVWLLTAEKTCRTSATVGDICAAGAGDEVVTTYDYGPENGPNNLLVRGKVVTADGISLRTCFGYDAVGNRISETKPRANVTFCP